MCVCECYRRDRNDSVLRAYRTPFVVGGPIGPKLLVLADESDVTTEPPTFVDTGDVTLIVLDVRLRFGDMAVPLLTTDVLAGDDEADDVITFDDDFVMKNFSSLAMMCLP